MEMIRVIYRGRMANRLFQYCLGRILSEELGCALKADPIPDFENTISYGRRSLLSLFRRTQRLKGGHFLEFEKIASDKSKRNLVLNGFFMRYEYYKKYKSQIKNDWLSQEKNYQFGKNDLTIHIRSGDLWQVNKSWEVHRNYPGLPYSFYERILMERQWDKVFIVSEIPDDPMALKIARQFSARIQSGSSEEDFNFLRSSSNLVMSVSTYSWWAAWLSDAQSVYFPITGIFDTEIRPDINLIPNDESRYQFIQMPDAGDWKGTEADRERLLNS